MKKVNGTIEAKGLSIRATLSGDGIDYISLTDIAKYKSDNPSIVINNWMRLRNTVEYLGVWEQLHNPNFILAQLDHFRSEAGENSFTLPPQKWIKETNAIGITSKSGRNGGTYAHSDIAFKFAAWISPEFELYIIKDYQRLKQAESDHLSLDWSARREIAKTNYRIHTDAIKEHLVDEKLPARYINSTYANEADIINVALFGMTAKEWRDQNPAAKGNIRDTADLGQLIVLSNLETLNAEFIKNSISQSDRLQRLREAAISQLKSVTAAASTERLAQRFDKK